MSVKWRVTDLVETLIGAGSFEIMNVIVPTGVEHDVFRKPLRMSSHRAFVKVPDAPIATTTAFASLIATSLISLVTPVHAQIGNIFSTGRARRPISSAANRFRSPRKRRSRTCRRRAVCFRRRTASCRRGRALRRPPTCRASRSRRRPAQRSLHRMLQPLIRFPVCRRGKSSRAAHRRHPRPCSRATKSSPSRPRRRSSTSRRCFAGLDKITGRIIKFDAEMGETVQFRRCGSSLRPLHAADGSGQHRCVRRSR